MDLLWTDFLNSDWHDWRGTGQSTDRLLKEEWLARFLGDWQLTAPVPPTPADRERLHELRVLLRRLTVAVVAGGRPSPADWTHLNQVLRGGPVARQAVPTETGYQLELVPLGSGWSQVMAEIAASFARTLAEGETARVRICENPNCLWVFYDETRSRTKRFCSEKDCGNLMKVRRFRARHRGTSETS